jgi:hypothetical protein
MAFWRTAFDVALILRRAAMSKAIGEKYTEEIVALFATARTQPREEILDVVKEAQKVAIDISQVDRITHDLKVQHPEWKEPQIELALAMSIPDAQGLADLVTDLEQTSEQASIRSVREFLPSAKTNTYLLFLRPPHILDSGCFVHFSYNWNETKQKYSYRIRDFVHGKIYFAVTDDIKKVELAWGKPVDSNKFSALEIWKNSLARVPTWGKKEYEGKDIHQVDYCKVKLKELTDAETRRK